MFSQKYVAEYDKEFIPCILWVNDFIAEAERSSDPQTVKIYIERTDGCASVHETIIPRTGDKKTNCFYIERLVKTLLWIKGGWKIRIGGPSYIGEYIRSAYKSGGSRDFDKKVMERIYEKDFIVEITTCDKIGAPREAPKPVGRHLDGYRIGFDAGGSDRKVSAVIDGDAVYSEEVIWNPKTNSDPEYHYQGIMESFRTAASKMPRVDGIGVSAAGIYVNNRVMIASLFIAVPEDRFNKDVKDIFIRAQKEMGNVPMEIANDGDVTALAGAMELGENNVMGIAMGTSQAGGYVDSKGNITGWLNELAFVPVDLNPASAVDEWSGDFGCGVKYFSQDAVIKLAGKAGLILSDYETPAQKLKYVQDLLEQGDPHAKAIFESIGVYLGYSAAWYSLFYDISHLLLLGRVTSGKGGTLITEMAKKLLADEFPELYAKLQIHMPDEKSKRVGQSIAAASLPVISG